jgi:hypothetical protein
MVILGSSLLSEPPLSPRQAAARLGVSQATVRLDDSTTVTRDPTTVNLRRAQRGEAGWPRRILGWRENQFPYPGEADRSSARHDRPEGPTHRFEVASDLVASAASEGSDLVYTYVFAPADESHVDSVASPYERAGGDVTSVRLFGREPMLAFASIELTAIEPLEHTDRGNCRWARRWQLRQSSARRSGGTSRGSGSKGSQSVFKIVCG